MKISDSRRASRMGDQILRELSSILMEEVSDPRLERVTLSGVRMNANLRIAEVLFTTSGDEEKIEAARQGLEKASGYLRSQLGKKMRIQFVPELRFTHDTFLEDMVYAKPDEDDS
ncbi:30S ribosome-binding factor RbfA [Desulfovibrio oxyclinae]|uniref:30S ribosome-binding factor RbfA n=1 Tax=Desulfovibrio oxyclinae TaxID=63560 RepID=UPI000361DEC2|nr:30S ribosome-binding factor RbfA [Desulfovibrio oxyclinae]